MKYVRLLIGDIVRIVALFHIVAWRNTILETLETALDTLVNSQIANTFIATAKSVWKTFIRRLRVSIWLATAGTIGGVIIGVIGFFYPNHSNWTAQTAFIVYASFFAMASVIMLWELVKGQIAKKAFVAILVTIRHSGSMLKQLLPQIIVGNWNADPILSEMEYLAQRVINTLWTVFIGVNMAALFVLVMGIFANPFAFLASSIAFILATAWAIRYSKDELFIKYASATIIVVTLIVSAGWSLWDIYTGSDAYRQGTKAEVAQRLISGRRELPGDKELLGSAYDDIKQMVLLQAKSNVSKCDKEQYYAYKKRANISMGGKAVLVTIPDCSTPPTKAVAQVTAAQNQTKERQEAFARVMGGRKTQQKGDRAILDGVYDHASELRGLLSIRNLDECRQGRAVKLKERILAYINGKEFISIKLPVCTQPTTASIRRSNASRPGNPAASNAMVWAAREVLKEMPD